MILNTLCTILIIIVLLMIFHLQQDQNLRITLLTASPTNLSANFVDYYNGQWYDGSSYDLQWRYNFSWSCMLNQI